MKKSKIKCALIFSSFILLLGIKINAVSAHQFTNYYGIHMTNDEYFTLLNLGFTDDEIYYMDEDTFNENKDLDAELISQTNKYYKIVSPIYGQSYVVEVSQSEALNQSQNQPFGQVITEYINEISSISANGSKYRYKDTVSWVSVPDDRNYDIIAIGFINSVYIDSMIYYKHSYLDSSATWHNSTLFYDKKNTATGGSVVFKLPTDFYGLSALIYFDVSKNTMDMLTGIAMCGDYAHSAANLTQYQAANHAINSGGIQLDPSVYSYYDDPPCAYAAATVNW